MIKVVCDACSRLIIFGAWMFTYNSWVFSTWMTVAYFYGMLAIMVAINVIFCYMENEKALSLRNSIGEKIFWKCWFDVHLNCSYYLGILLNSLMTILSFNHFDFALMFGNVQEEERQGRRQIQVLETMCLQRRHNRDKSRVKSFIKTEEDTLLLLFYSL